MRAFASVACAMSGDTDPAIMQPTTDAVRTALCIVAFIACSSSSHEPISAVGRASARHRPTKPSLAFGQLLVVRGAREFLPARLCHVAHQSPIFLVTDGPETVCPFEGFLHFRRKVKIVKALHHAVAKAR